MSLNSWGISSALVTLSTYAHTMEKMARDAVNRLADSCFPQGPVSRSKCEKM